MPKLAEFSFDEAKNRKLKAERGIGFEEIITYIESGCIIENYDNPNAHEYAGQKIYAVNMEGYIWLVPYRIEKGNKHLITAFPSRKAVRKYKKERKNETD